MISTRMFDLGSILTEDVNVILSFFDKKVRLIKLLHRASDERYCPGRFQQNCKDKPNTIVLVKT